MKKAIKFLQILCIKMRIGEMKKHTKVIGGIKDNNEDMYFIYATG